MANMVTIFYVIKCIIPGTQLLSLDIGCVKTVLLPTDYEFIRVANRCILYNIPTFLTWGCDKVFRNNNPPEHFRALVVAFEAV